MTQFQFATLCVILITGICSVFYCASRIREVLIECTDKLLAFGGFDEDWYEECLLYNGYDIPEQAGDLGPTLDTGCSEKDGRKYEC